MLFIVVIPCMLVSYLILSFTRNYYSLPRSFRGPFLACISDFWLFKQCVNANLCFAQERLLAQNASLPGPNLARIGPRLLVTNDPGLLRHMSQPKSKWTRGGWYDGFQMGGNTAHVFAERDEQKHRALRAKLGNGYSGKGVTNLELCIDIELQNFINLLREQYARPHKTLDMTRGAQFFTLDVLSSIAFGSPFGFLAANADKWDFIAGNETFTPMLQLITDVPFIWAVFQSSVAQWLFSPRETDEVGVGRIRRFATEAIVKRFEGEKQDKSDMLGSFKANGLSLEECKSESLIQVIAGTDSTSTTLRMGMLYIASNPIIYRKLQSEVDNAVAEGRVSKDEIVSDSVARSLPYLQAVIWEALRTTPPLFGLKSKLSPPEGETFNGVFFPPGIEVAECARAVTHRKDIFGDDAHVFRPERFLEGDPEARNKLERTTELVFGTGRFGCLGRNIAWIELGKAFFELMRHFDWTIADPLNPIRKNIAYESWIQEGMDMIVHERHREAELV